MGVVGSYNLMLDKKIKAYEFDKTKYSAFDLMNEIPKLRNEKNIFERHIL